MVDPPHSCFPFAYIIFGCLPKVYDYCFSVTLSFLLHHFPFSWLFHQYCHLSVHNISSQDIKAIKKQISELSIDFTKNLNEDTTYFLFTCAELEGLPKDFIDSLERVEDGDRYKVTLMYPHYFPLMKKCSVEETRRKMEFAFNSRCKEENSRLLEKLISLRARQAAILGFDSHADFILDMTMAKKTSTVANFLDGLSGKLQALGEAERAEMLHLKREELKKTGQTFDGVLHAWDLRYYANQVEITRYAVDHNVLQQYFPLEVRCSNKLLFQCLPYHYLSHQRWREVVFTPVCLSVNKISQKVVDGFGRNFVESLGV
uniref:Peptidase M3A/M3B catalytic domain-containing protein n=1 Tax=Eptatretus burgeri TaxID=7764 RepID=A0A8C4N221_EPTBU